MLAEISSATGRDLKYVPSSHEQFIVELTGRGWPAAEATEFADARIHRTCITKLFTAACGFRQFAERRFPLAGNHVTVHSCTSQRTKSVPSPRHTGHLDERAEVVSTEGPQMHRTPRRSARGE
ncbi:hypothetical protein [Nocardia sp.]|uniref:hypothetical protein n=1 Tax=Nocardia sp. TaxID=1821 RepID=UPI00258D4759|nr:hypothetical protein [Nocardia sp.]